MWLKKLVKYKKKESPFDDMKLKRYEGNPILRPKPDSKWEKGAVFNPAAIYYQGKVHLLYRAVGEYENYVSRIGYAISDDGFRFERISKRPVFWPRRGYEKGAIEDPRLIKIKKRIFMTYVALGVAPHQRPKPGVGMLKQIPKTALASTTNFKKWQRHGSLTPEGADDRDAVLFSEKINNKFVLIHRPHNWIGRQYGTMAPAIWIAYSRNLRKWYSHNLLMTPQEKWEETKIGVGPPPLKTEVGWLLIYHGRDRKGIYRVGAALLDLKDPEKIIARTKEPILEPEKDYEKKGDIPNVVFPEGIVLIDDKLFVYYGAADKVCGVATISLNKFLDYLLSECKL